MLLKVPGGTVVEVTVNVPVMPLALSAVAVASKVPLAPLLKNSTAPSAGAAPPELAITVAVNETLWPWVALSGPIELIDVVVPTAVWGTNATPRKAVLAGKAVTSDGIKEAIEPPKPVASTILMSPDESVAYSVTVPLLTLAVKPS